MVIKSIAKILKRFGYSLVETDQSKYQKPSFSQCGEDVIIDYIFKLRGVSRPSYIDIGANNPFYLSNTALFYNKGCRGINIEANPELIGQFYRFRPQDVNINIGISDEEGEMDFYVMEDSTLSTFSKHEAEEMTKFGKNLKKIEKVRLTTVKHILEEYWDGKFPDILSLDVEGLDFEILKNIDFAGNCPKVICVEAAEFSSDGTGARRTEIIDYLVNNGYYEYANTNLNAIMVRNSFWFKK